MRVYLAATLPAMRTACVEGAFAQASRDAFAVTPMLGEMHLGDEEELEYLAQRLAGRQSLRLLAADSAAPHRRVVIAADVAAELIERIDRAAPGAVLLTRPLSWSDVAAGLVDSEDAEEVVRAAVAALPAAAGGDADAQFAVDDAEGYELAWWATQELPGLV